MWSEKSLTLITMEKARDVQLIMKDYRNKKHGYDDAITNYMRLVASNNQIWRICQ